MVSITGSVRAGIEVAQAAAADLKRVHLELGGKAPVIVFDDADPAKAAEAIAIAGYFNAGQDCTAATRVLAGPGIHDDFAAALTEQAAAQVTAGPDNEDATYGPLNNANQLDRVSGFISRLPDHARILAGGRRVGDRGYFFEASVVDGLQQNDEIIQNEVFGPVITVQKFTDEDEALRWANGTAVRPGVVGLDVRPRPGHADGAGAGLRLRVDQHPHPAGRRDAARRVQALGLRQGPVDVRVRGLHPGQARDVVARLSRGGAARCAAGWPTPQQPGVILPVAGGTTSLRRRRYARCRTGQRTAQPPAARSASAGAAAAQAEDSTQQRRAIKAAAAGTRA